MVCTFSVVDFVDRLLTCHLTHECLHLFPIPPPPSHRRQHLLCPRPPMPCNQSLDLHRRIKGVVECIGGMMHATGGAEAFHGILPHGPNELLNLFTYFLGCGV